MIGRIVAAALVLTNHDHNRLKSHESPSVTNGYRERPSRQSNPSLPPSALCDMSTANNLRTPAV